jgi:hypothetical protein
LREAKKINRRVVILFDWARTMCDIPMFAKPKQKKAIDLSAQERLLLERLDFLRLTSFEIRDYSSRRYYFHRKVNMKFRNYGI